ncbi:thioredoxin domain-containing protein 11 isoform X2 [Ostrinia furnacalis]|uniref:thioredoxin domain-containing protein 11 isoform X2 n=1 Tax=Ostrinia furnacalis TaxID=93504 RepID=UPI00103DCE42|nr:thioredoxin domain-containing protein 11 isoform X2 [Ostrinia furnacalis]
MFPTADTEDIVQVTSLNRKPCVNSDVRDSSDNTQLAKQQTNRELTLNMLVKEIIFCIAVALTTYGALHNPPPKISKHPQAVRFFDPESAVTDWYRGQLSDALGVVNSVDISFVMYYAPWDAESQYVRGEFDKAATVLGDRVHFSAINCWNPGSECRLQNNKIPSWPILMAYTVTSRGVLYKGPRDAQSIVKFLQLIMKPLDRVSSTEDLINLISICDAVAIGFTPLAETSKFYNIWYYVALKAREFDTVGEICFAVVTSESLAAELGIHTVPNVRLMLWNTTKEYTAEDPLRPWNESAILQWVLENFTQPVSRIIPMWKKAFSFERYADGNPILILFTPLNPLYEQIPSYALLREVAMEYYSCKTNNSNYLTSELIRIQKIQRLIYERRNYAKYCESLKHRKPKQNLNYKREIVSHNNKYPWYNATHNTPKTLAFDYLLKHRLAMSKALDSANDEADIVATLAMLQQCDTKVMPAEKEFYDIYEQCEKYEESLAPEQELESDCSNLETSMLPFDDDPLSVENLFHDHQQYLCRIFNFANEIGPPVAPARIANAEEKQNISRVEGLACEKNFTLHMLAVDSVRNHHFAEFLGIDVTNVKDKTAVVILDTKLETQYLLSEEYSAKSVRDFIYNFTHKKLKRYLRTHVEDASHTHYFGSEENVGDESTNENIVDIIDLTTKTFRKIVRTPGTVSIVAVCGGACSAGTTRAISAAARLLRSCGVRARPARLDALRHDLPWHYTASHYPTIFVFSADGREAESRTYPAAQRVSSSGLVALALRALGPRRHLRVRLALCAATQVSGLDSIYMLSDKKTCLRELREHVTTVIARSLKYWRRTEHRELKAALLRRLQYLHQVSLDLSTLHITDLHENSQKQKTLLNSLSLLSENWDIDVSILSKNVTSTEIRS